MPRNYFYSDLLLYIPFEGNCKPQKIAGSLPFVKGSEPLFVEGISGEAVFLGKDDTEIIIPLKNNLNPDQGSICFWIRPEYDYTLASPNRIFFDMRYEKGSIVENDPSQRMALTYSVQKGRTFRYYLSIDRNRYLIGTRRLRSDYRTRAMVISGAQSFKKREWIHIAVTWDKKWGKIYINGRLEGANLLTSGLPKLPDFLQIGAKETWIGGNANASLDEFLIYRKALNEKEVSMLYEGYSRGKVNNDTVILRRPNDLVYKIHSPTMLKSGEEITLKGLCLRFSSGSIVIQLQPDFDKYLSSPFILLQSKERALSQLFKFGYPLGSYRTWGCIMAKRILEILDYIEDDNLEIHGQRVISGTQFFDKGDKLELELRWDRQFGNLWINGQLQGVQRWNDPIPDNFASLVLGSKKNSAGCRIEKFEIYQNRFL